MSETSRNLSRRKFMAVSSAAIAAPILMNMAGAVPEAKASEKEYDFTDRKNCDFVVAGSGSGMVAAVRAALAGYKVIILEKTKIIGGGMPLAAVAGRQDILELAGRSGSVRFSGGTYSGHPACLLASKSMLGYLAENEKTVYPYINNLAVRIRETVEKAFAAQGLYARCTGTGEGSLPGSSISTVVFPYEREHLCKGPEETLNPHVCDVQLSNRVLQLALLLENVHVIHGLGSISTAHSQADISVAEQAYGRAAERIKASL